MAPDRSFYPASEARGVAPVWRTHDGLNRFEQITTPASSDPITHPSTPRARYDAGILRNYCGVQRWRFAGDLSRHRLAPHEFQQDARDGLHPSFTQRSGICSRENLQTAVETYSAPSLIARLDLYSSLSIPRFNPTRARAQMQIHRRQALPTKTIGDMIQADETIALGATESSPKVKAAVKAAGWVEKVRKKRRCSDLFNKNFSFGPASQPNSSQQSPRVSPRSSISSASSRSMVEEPVKRQRIDSSNPRTFYAHSEATLHDECSSTHISSKAHPHQSSTRDTLLDPTPHPGHPVDFAATDLEPYDKHASVIDWDSYFESHVYDNCFESSQRRSSFSNAYLRHEIAEEGAHRERLNYEEARDEIQKRLITGRTSSIVSSNETSYRSPSTSSRLSTCTRASSSDSTDSMEAFLRHVRESFEARKQRELNDKMFEDEVGRFYASSEPL